MVHLYAKKWFDFEAEASVLRLHLNKVSSLRIVSPQCYIELKGALHKLENKCEFINVSKVFLEVFLVATFQGLSPHMWLLYRPLCLHRGSENVAAAALYSRLQGSRPCDVTKDRRWLVAPLLPCRCVWPVCAPVWPSLCVGEQLHRGLEYPVLPLLPLDADGLGRHHGRGEHRVPGPAGGDVRRVPAGLRRWPRPLAGCWHCLSCPGNYCSGDCVAGCLQNSPCDQGGLLSITTDPLR